MRVDLEQMIVRLDADIAPFLDRPLTSFEAAILVDLVKWRERWHAQIKWLSRAAVMAK